MKNILKQSTIIFICIITYNLNAQNGILKISGNKAQIGYNSYNWLGLGFNSSNPSLSQSQWGIEHWDGGLNFWVPWPAANNGNYKMFLNQFGMLGVDMKPMGRNYTNSWGQSMNQWAAKLWVNGRCASDGYFTWSDSSVKGSIVKMENNLTNVLKLNPVSYKYKSNKFGDNIAPSEEVLTQDETKQATINAERSVLKPDFEDITHFGFIAQELKRVCPTVVADLGGIEGVNLPEMVPMLVGAIQEQQVIIEQLKQEIQELKGKTVYTDVDQSKLYQNNPNPFRGSTTFTYFIDEATSVSSAIIEIRNIMGILQNTITLGDKSGLGKIEFNAENLAEGYYVYALKVNGNLKDSKMLLIGE